MECLKLRYILFFLVSMTFVTGTSQIYREVNDLKTAEQIGINTIWQEVTEKEHNALLDSVSSMQQEIAFKTTSIAGIKGLYNETLQNTAGFEAESMFYKEIASTSTKIANVAIEIYASIKKSNTANKASAIMAVSDMVAKSSQLVSDFVNIVTNGKVKNPDANSTSSSKKNDGGNFLNRYERMRMASKISYDLKLIYNRLNRVNTLLQYGTVSDIIYQLDHKTWASLINAKSTADKIKRQWNTNVKR